MNISEQVKELREIVSSGNPKLYTPKKIRKMILQAADTIESLSEKLQAANMELERWHTDHINEKIKNPFAYTSTLICHNCDHKDEYIEELEAEVEELKAVNMERSAEDCGGWIYCGDGKNLPEEKINPITKDFCEYQVTFKSEDVTDIRHYKFGRGHWWNGPGIMDEYVIAWRQNLEPYHEP